MNHTNQQTQEIEYVPINEEQERLKELVELLVVTFSSEFLVSMLTLKRDSAWFQTR